MPLVGCLDSPRGNDARERHRVAQTSSCRNQALLPGVETPRLRPSDGLGAERGHVVRMPASRGPRNIFILPRDDPDPGICSREPRLSPPRPAPRRTDAFVPNRRGPRRTRHVVADAPACPRHEETSPSPPKPPVGTPLALSGQRGGEQPALQDREQTTVIRRLTSGAYRLYSRKVDSRTGKRRNLGTFPSREAALRHERQIQFFKRAR